MKCIQCGKEIHEEKAVLCKDCIMKKYSCLKGYEEHTLLICPSCQRYKWNKAWKAKKPVLQAIEEAVLSHCSFTVHPKKQQLHITVEEKRAYQRQKGSAILRTHCLMHNQEIEETFTFPLRLTYTFCDICARAQTNYYEGILQLRGENKTLLEQAHAFLLDETMKQKDKGIFITKIEEQKKGYDYYYTKQRVIPVLMKKLVKKFGATASSHARLFTEKKGEKLYRVTAIVRLP